MPGTAKAAKREFRLLLRYVRKVKDRWRAILASAAALAMLWAFNRYLMPLLSGLASQMPPEATPWLTSNRLIVISGVAVISLAQYLIWREATLKLHKIQKEKTRQTIAAELDLKFGPSSNLTGARQIKLATARFEQLEKEVYSGDYSNSSEVVIFKDIFIPILKGWFGGGVGYPEWHARLVKLVETVGQYEREQVEEELD
jgi:hypothetical protein